MITYFKDKNHKSKKKYKNNKTLNKILESVDTVVNIGPTKTPVTLSVIGFGLMVVVISAGIACTLSLGNKVLHKLIINKQNKNEKNNMKKINKQLNLSINFAEHFHKIM